MKILHWDEMFHPAFGYQINVLAKYQAMQNNEVVIYTAQHPEIHPTFRGLNKVDVEKLDKEYSKKYHVKIVRLPIYGVISGRVIYKEGFIKKIKEEAPDILMCHTNDTLSAIYIAKRYKYLNMPIVFDNHMLEMGSQNPFRKFFRMYFRYRVTPLIKKNRWKVIRTQDDTFVEREYGIPLEQAPFISFGSDINMFHPDMNVKKEFRKKYGIRLEDVVVVYTGKISEAKGGKLLALAFKEKFQASRNVVLVVVGTARSQYELEVEDIFKQSKNRIIRFNTQNYVDLPQFYQMADLSVFAKQCSLSFYDAQACGLPVVSEDNNINIDRLSHRNGFVFKKGDVADFREKIIKCINMPQEEYQKIKENAENFIDMEYNYADISKRYTQVMQEAIEEFKQTRNN